MSRTALFVLVAVLCSLALLSGANTVEVSLQSNAAASAALEQRVRSGLDALDAAVMELDADLEDDEEDEDGEAITFNDTESDSDSDADDESDSEGGDDESNQEEQEDEEDEAQDDSAEEALDSDDAAGKKKKTTKKATKPQTKSNSKPKKSTPSKRSKPSKPGKKPAPAKAPVATTTSQPKASTPVKQTASASPVKQIKSAKPQSAPTPAKTAAAKSESKVSPRSKRSKRSKSRKNPKPVTVAAPVAPVVAVAAPKKPYQLPAIIANFTVPTVSGSGCPAGSVKVFSSTSNSTANGVTVTKQNITVTFASFSIRSGLGIATARNTHDCAFSALVHKPVGLCTFTSSGNYEGTIYLRDQAQLKLERSRTTTSDVGKKQSVKGSKVFKGPKDLGTPFKPRFPRVKIDSAMSDGDLRLEHSIDATLSPSKAAGLVKFTKLSVELVMQCRHK